jgi:hypothetical protein
VTMSDAIFACSCVGQQLNRQFCEYLAAHCVKTQQEKMWAHIIARNVATSIIRYAQRSCSHRLTCCPKHGYIIALAELNVIGEWNQESCSKVIFVCRREHDVYIFQFFLALVPCLYKFKTQRVLLGCRMHPCCALSPVATSSTVLAVFVASAPTATNVFTCDNRPKTELMLAPLRTTCALFQRFEHDCFLRIYRQMFHGSE